MENVDQIIHAKWILPCEETSQILENHALLVKDKRIHAILPSKEAETNFHTKEKIHLNEHVLMPGFINSHTHSAMNLFRGLADDLELMDWLHHHIWPRESKWVSEEMVYDGTRLAIAEMIRSGTTCFNDMYFFLQAAAKATEEAGVRAGIGMTVINVPTAWAKTADEYFDKAMQFYEQYKNHDFVKPTLAPHSTYGVDTAQLERAKTLSDALKLKTNIHLQEDPTEIALSQKKYGKRPLQRLYEMGLVDSNLIAVHMTQLDENDCEILAATKPNIVHCPESNMKLVSGCCKVDQLRRLNINVALGTDGAASNNDLDMIGEMRSAAFLGKITANDPKALPVEYVLKMATLNGAKALGIDAITGSLTPGKSADFIAIDMNQLETQPLYHPISQIVYSSGRNQVTDVWVAGKALMRNRKLQTLDETELLAKAKSWQEKLK